MEDMYPNLPGILAEFKDGGLVLRDDPNPPSTESILLLGTAIDGPIMEPVAIDANNLEALFGKAVNSNGTSNGSTLIKAFEQAYAGGCRDIRLMRVTGKRAGTEVKAASTTFNTDKSHDETLGLASGNAQTEFKLNQVLVDAATVSVQVGSVDLTNQQFTVQNGVAAVPGTPAVYTITTDSTPDPGKTYFTEAGGVYTPSSALVSFVAGTDYYEETTAAIPGIPAVPAAVTVLDNQVNANSQAIITYSYLSGGATVTVREDAFVTDTGALQYYVTQGTDTEYPLSLEPKAGSTSVYANGLIVADNLYTVDAANKKIIVKAGATELGVTLEASYLHVESVTEEPTVKVESVFGGYLYNDTTVEIRNVVNAAGQPIGKELIITKPLSKKAQITEEPLRFASIDIPTFGQLVRAVNSHPKNNVVRLSINKRYENVTTNSLQVQAVTALSGGDNGTNVSKQAIFEALGGKRDLSGYVIEPGAYQLLENYSVDQVIPVGVYADDELAGRYDNFAYQLALACAVMSFRGTATLGVIATSSPDETGLKAIDEHVKHLMSIDFNFSMRDRDGNVILDSEQKEIDLGRYISIVAGPDVTLGSGRFGLYAQNSAPLYGGMISNMKVQSAPTNKPLPGAQGLRFSFSNQQLNELTGANFVTFKTKRNGEVVSVVDAMTAAKSTSDYKRLVTYRVVKRAVNEVRDVCDPYIGEPNEVQQRNAMSAAISKRLDAMKEDGGLMDYDFQVIATPEMQLLGQAQIELTLVPPMELRQITVVVNLRTTL